MKVLLTSISVQDPIAAFKFYTEVLGFKEQLFIPDANLAVVVSAEDPNGTGILLEPTDSPMLKQYQLSLFKEGLPVIVFSVEDLHSEYERLKSSGIIFRKAPIKTEWGLEAIFEDSFGNLIQLMEQPH